MLSAHLYNRDSRKLTPLDAASVMSTMPFSAEELAEGAVSANGVEGQNGDKAQAKGTVKGAFRRTMSRCRQGELLWIDITAPTSEEYQLLVDRFGLHAMVVEDLRSREGRPKLHDYGEYIYIIFHALRYEIFHGDDEDDDDHDDVEVLPHADRFGNRYRLKVTEIDCLVGSDYVVTLHPEPLQPLQDLHKRWKANPNLMRPGASYLLYEIMDEVLDDYFPLLDALDERIDELQDRLLTDFEANMSGDIFALKRCLVQVRRVAGPTRDVANILLRRDADSGGKHFVYFQDLYDHSVRIVDMVDTFRDILSGALDAYLAMASNRMNEVMKTLTAASIMLLVPTFIAGIYGMNFENMPELKWKYGYFVALGVMASTMAGIFAYFRRKKWL